MRFDKNIYFENAQHKKNDRKTYRYNQSGNDASALNNTDHTPSGTKNLANAFYYDKFMW